MDNKKCKDLKCSKCSFKLCYEDKKGIYQIVGHFNFGNKAFCVTCFKKHEQEIIRENDDV